MKVILAACVVAAAAALPAAPAATASNEIPEGVEWVKDWGAAMAAAAERGAPILVSFANDD